MPRRTDIESICIVGSGPIVIGQAAEFDYAGCQALKVLREDGFRTIVVNSNPATIMTDPGFADRTYLEPLDAESVAEVLRIERPDALLPTMGGQTALNLARELANEGVLDELGIELIGARLDAIERAEDRLKFKDAVESCGLKVPTSVIVTSVDELAGVAVPAVVRPAFTLGGHGGGFAYTEEELRRQVERGLAESPDRPGAGRGVGARLGRVRARGRPRPDRQRRHRLLDREPRPDGRPYRRLRHGRAADDAARRGVPGAARRGGGRDPRGRRRHRRLEHPVRPQPRDRRRARDRDEPARLPLVRARLQGDRLPDREGRGAARRGLHARRDPERPDGDDARELRADARLRRRQVPALRVREVPRRRPDARHADEVGGRDDGHRPHLRRGVPQGVPLARARRRRRDAVARARGGSGGRSPVLPARARPDPRGARLDRRRRVARRRRLAAPQAAGALRRGHRNGGGHERGSGAAAAARLRRPARVPPRRLVRRRGRGRLELLLLHLGRGWTRRRRPGLARGSSSSARDRTGSGRGSSSTTAASTPSRRTASSATRR